MKLMPFGIQVNLEIFLFKRIEYNTNKKKKGRRIISIIFFFFIASIDRLNFYRALKFLCILDLCYGHEVWNDRIDLILSMCATTPPFASTLKMFKMFTNRLYTVHISLEIIIINHNEISEKFNRYIIMRIGVFVYNAQLHMHKI